MVARTSSSWTFCGTVNEKLPGLSCPELGFSVMRMWLLMPVAVSMMTRWTKSRFVTIVCGLSSRVSRSKFVMVFEEGPPRSGGLVANPPL